MGQMLVITLDEDVTKADIVDAKRKLIDKGLIKSE
jgi:hypothetical protein